MRELASKTEKTCRRVFILGSVEGRENAIIINAPRLNFGNKIYSWREARSAQSIRSARHDKMYQAGTAVPRSFFFTSSDTGSGLAPVNQSDFNACPNISKEHTHNHAHHLRYYVGGGKGGA